MTLPGDPAQAFKKKSTAAIWILAALVGAVTTTVGTIGLFTAILRPSIAPSMFFWIFAVIASAWSVLYLACFLLGKAVGSRLNFPMAIVWGALVGPLFLIVIPHLLLGSGSLNSFLGTLITLPAIAIAPIVLVWPALLYLSRTDLDFRAGAGVDSARTKARRNDLSIRP